MPKGALGGSCSVLHSVAVNVVSPIEKVVRSVFQVVQSFTRSKRFIYWRIPKTGCKSRANIHPAHL